MNPQLRKLLIDFGPLVAFFAVYKVWGIYPATIAVIVATLGAVAAGYWCERRIAPVPVFTAILVAALGGLTLYLRDDTFIKMKPTFVYAVLGLVLIGSEWCGRPVIRKIMATAVSLRDVAWRGLSYRFGGFFLVMALANEVVWRNFSRDVWVNYHVFGAFGLTLLFAVSQGAYLMKYRIPDDETPQSGEGVEK